MRKRDDNLDVIRGLALATITVNHFSSLVGELGYRGAQFPTFTQFGHSSAAEIFFLMSGYLLGVLYLQPAANGAIGRFAFMATARALKLYFYNLVLFIVLFGVVSSAGSDAFAAASNYAHYFASPKRVAEVLTFRSHPYLLGILQLYVCFLLAAPVFALMVRRSVLLASCASLALWCGAQIWPEFNATGGSPEGDWQWNFNPFAWQLLFFGGMILGRYNLTPAMLRLSQRRGVVVASIALLGLATAVHAAEIWAPSVGLRFRMPATGKEGLGAVRLAHALLVVWVLYLALARLRRPERNPVIAMAAMIGRTSLDSFAASVVITYALALV